MAALLAQLVEVRSQLAEAMLAYLKATEEELAKNRLLERFERKLDDLRVPLRVAPHEPVRDIEEIRAREHFRQTGSGGGDEAADKATRRAYAFRGALVDQDKESRSRPEPLAGLEPKLEMAVLLGDPGSGKTEWLKYRARLAAREAREKLEQFAVGLDDLCFPAWLRLPDVAAELREEKESELRHLLVETGCVSSLSASLNDAERAAAAMLSSLIKHHKLSKNLAPWLWQRLTARRQASAAAPILLCLDAWDEIRSRQETVARCLNAYASTAQARIFLTSRIIGYSHRPLPVENKTEGPRRELRICPFKWSETEVFVTDFFRGAPERGQAMLGELRSKIAISGMAQNPLLATLMCMAFSPNLHRPPLGFPARRVEVYGRVLEELLGEWEAIDKGQKPDRDLISAKIRLLEELAYHFFPGEELTGDLLHDFLWDEGGGYLTKLDEVHPFKQMLRQNGTTVTEELGKDGVLVPSGGAETEDFLFLHLTFQEYLTACALARRAKPKQGGWQKIAGFVNAKSWAGEWEEVIVLLAGKLDDPIPLLELLSDPETDDLYRHRLCLAARCLLELSKSGHQKFSHAFKKAAVLKEQKLELLTQSIAKGVLSFWLEHWTNFHAFSRVSRCLPTIAQSASTAVLPVILKLLCDQNPDVRASAAYALEKMGKAAASHPDVLPSLIKASRDHDRLVCRIAVNALQEMRKTGDSPPNVLPTLSNSQRGRDSSEDRDSLPASQLPFLINNLRDQNSDSRAGSAYVLGQTGMASHPEVLPLLINTLRDQDSDVRVSAVYALGEMRETVAAHPEVLRLLINVLFHDQSSFVRNDALDALAKIGKAAASHPEVLSLLINALRDQDSDVRDGSEQALNGMGEAGVSHPKVLRLLINALRDEYHNVRRSAAHGLRLLRESAASNPEVLSALAKTLLDQDIYVRQSAAEALGEMGKTAASNPDVLLSLVNALLDQDRDMRSCMAKALGQIGEAAASHPDVLSALISALRDKDCNVRGSAAGALGRMGKAAASHPDVVPSLINALRDREYYVRMGAVEALGKMGEAAASHANMVPLLIKASQDQNAFVRRNAVEALGKIEKTAVSHPKVLSSLVEALHGEVIYLCWDAAKVLEGMMASGARIFEVRQKDKWSGAKSKKKSANWESCLVSELSTWGRDKP